MLSEIFNKDVVDKIFKAKMREYQRNRYKHKEVKKNLFLPFRAAPMAYGGSQSRD